MATIESSSQDSEKNCRESGEELLHQLKLTTTLVERCALLSADPDIDQLQVIRTSIAASQASAQLAQALAKVSRAEPRQRRIIEVVQTPAPQIPVSFSTFDALLAALSPQARQILAEEIQRSLPKPCDEEEAV